MTQPVYESLTQGEVVAEREIHLTRDSLVRYAGASLDFNPIHYRDDVAQSVGLPGVLAHGMLTMGVAASPVLEWFGTAGFVVDYQARFTRPVAVDGHSGATVCVVATVGALDDEQRRARIDVQASFDGKTVLGKAQLMLQFSEASA